MKIILFLFCVLLSVSVCFAENCVLKNADMQIVLSLDSKNIVFRSIKDIKSGTEFVKGIVSDRPLWYFTVKKDRDYSGEEIKLAPSDAENIIIKQAGAKAEIIWKNVKKDDMKTGFDVTASAELKDNNSYWHLKISSNEEYGIWHVFYPYIANMNASDGDEIMYPYRGGWVYDKFSDPRGFRKPYGHDAEDIKSYSKDLGYISPNFMQLGSFTKIKDTKKVSLYFSSEDLTSSMKSVNYFLPEPNVFDYYVRNFPSYMAEAGRSYSQSYKFNMAVVRGDWFDCAKKYRKWGIKNRYSIFAKGKLEDRKDLPDWFKYNPVWLRWTAAYPYALENVIKTQNFLGVKCGCHIYYWSVHPFDTFYPGWLPPSENIADGIKRLHENNMFVMPYTNALITDINQSSAYKKYGSEMITVNERGELEDTPYKSNGADNRVSCINSVYYKAYADEIIQIAKTLDIDALYMDQIGASPQYVCFNEKHSHPKGGGDRWVKEYTRLVNETRENLNKILNKNIAITTEDAGDAVPYDAWLRCNDEMAGNENTPVDTVVYSGYGTSFGDRSYKEEFEEDNGLPARNRVAVSLCKGVQPGWYMGTEGEVFKYPVFGKYFKNAVLARKAAIKYFNFGELIRPVKIINKLPEKELLWKHYSGDDRRVYPMVRTACFNYKGKTAIIFTNISEEKIKTEFEAAGKDLLPGRKDIKLTELYPRKGRKIANTGKYGSVKAVYETEPLTTYVLIAE